jgi:hypothetical protein
VMTKPIVFARHALRLHQRKRDGVADADVVGQDVIDGFKDDIFDDVAWILYSSLAFTGALMP